MYGFKAARSYIVIQWALHNNMKFIFDSTTLHTYILASGGTLLTPYLPVSILIGATPHLNLAYADLYFF